MSTRSRYALRGIAVSYLNIAASFGIGLLFTPIAISFLGAEAFGLWKTLAGSLMSYLLMLEFGLTTTAVRFIARYRSADDEQAISRLVSTVAVLYLLLGALIVVISAVLTRFLGPLLRVPPELLPAGQLTMLLVGCLVAALLLTAIPGAIVGGFERYDVHHLITLLVTVGSPLLSVLLLLLGLGLPALALGGLLSVLLTALAELLFVWRAYPQIAIRPRLFERAMVGELLRFSGFVFVLNLGAIVVSSSDNLVIARTLGLAAVAPYALAFTLCTMALQLVHRVSEVLLPVFSDLYARADLPALQRFYPQMVRLSLALSCALALAVVFVGPRFLGLWVPEVAFAGTATLALLGASAALGGGIVRPSQVTVQSIGVVRPAALGMLAEAALNVALSLLLARWLGLAGVALGTLLGQLLVSAWLLPRLVTREIAMPFGGFLRAALPRPLLALPPAALIAALIGAIELHAGLAESVGGRVFGIALVGLKGALIIGCYLAIYYLLAPSNDRQFVAQKLRTALAR